MTTTRRSFITTAAALGTAGLFATPAILRAQDKKVLRLGHPHPESDSWQAAAQAMAKSLSEKTDGALELQIFPNGLLGNDPTMVNAVRAGTIDIVLTGNPYFTGLAPRMNVLDLPFLFRDRAHVAAVLDGDIGKDLSRDLLEADLYPLSIWEIGWRNITNSRNPVETPADIKGLKLRTTPNPAHIEAFKLLGAIPTPMAFTELFTALEMRSVDGQENPTSLILNARFYEVQKYVSLTRHAFTSAPLVANRGKIEAMDPALRSALLEAAAEAAVLQRKLNEERESTSLQSLIDEGMKAVESPDREAFAEICAAPVRKTFADQFGPELADSIVALNA